MVPFWRVVTAVPIQGFRTDGKQQMNREQRRIAPLAVRVFVAAKAIDGIEQFGGAKLLGQFAGLGE